MTTLSRVVHQRRLLHEEEAARARARAFLDNGGAIQGPGVVGVNEVAGDEAGGAVHRDRGRRIGGRVQVRGLYDVLKKLSAGLASKLSSRRNPLSPCDDLIKHKPRFPSGGETRFGLRAQNAGDE
jgi:hypothetical protein